MRNVLYTQRVEIIEAYQERRDCADQRIADFIYACGFLPIPVPNKAELAEKFVKELNPSGIILTGGNSLTIYGGNAPERDSMDKALIDISINRSIPLYGFCRGMQSVLDYFGNELTDVNGHVAVRHLIQAGLEKYEVNSYHNQACTKLKSNCGLLVVAETEDGIIEAVRHEVYPIYGTMWHPERENLYAGHDLESVKLLFGKVN